MNTHEKSQQAIYWVGIASVARKYTHHVADQISVIYVHTMLKKNHLRNYLAECSPHRIIYYSAQVCPFKLDIDRKIEEGLSHPAFCMYICDRDPERQFLFTNTALIGG